SSPLSFPRTLSYRHSLLVNLSPLNVSPLGTVAIATQSRRAGRRGIKVSFLESLRICSRPLILDVLCYASHCGFCCEEIAGTIDGDPLSHGSLGRISLVRRHEDGHLAVLQAPNANALEPAGMPLCIRFRVCSINHVAPVYRQPAHPAEFPPFTEIPPFLRQDLNSVVVAVGDDQPSLGVELNRVWCSELPWPGSGLTDEPQELAVSVEHRDTADKIRILDVGMALRNVYIAVAGVRDDVVRLGQRVRWISLHSRSAQRHKHLAIGTELDNNAALLVFPRKLGAFFGCRERERRSPTRFHLDRRGWPDEHAAAKAPDLLPGLVEEMDRVCLGAETAWSNSWRAPVRCPNGLAGAVDGYTIGTAPRPLLQRELSPIADGAIGVGAAVDGLNFVSLGGLAPLLSLHAGALGGDADNDHHRAHESTDN